MGEKLVVGNVSKGLSNYLTPFNIDNDAFPTLFNAYQWRGRVKRKRGTKLLGRLQRFFRSTSTSYNPGSTTIVLGAGGAGNLLTGFTNLLAITPNASLAIGSITIIDSTGPQTYTDPNMDGTLTGSLGGTGTINYQTGAFTITGGAGHTVTATFIYYPSLFVMGLRDQILSTNTNTGTPADNFPRTLAFDTKYSYNILPDGQTIYDVTFYKNLATATYPGYVRKTNDTPFTWVGQDYQQFWTVNYQNALWATNGIKVPFDPTVIGMQFKPIVTTTIVAGGPPALVTLNIIAHGLVVGDFVFVNEVVTTTGINFQTGYVVTVTDANNVIVEFPNATIATNGTGGIAQYLTNTANPNISGIRWYDGDPTNASTANPLLNTINGWVNFAPPLCETEVSINDTPKLQYYLAGARMIMQFKDRLLFIGPVIQTSGASSQIYLQDTVIFSQNGTPYYTASYTNSPNAAVDTPASPTNVLTPILVPANQTATPAAWFEDITGFGGSISAGYSSPIVSVGANEDVLIMKFASRDARLVSTGDGFIPFLFFFINSEFGTQSTFSIATMDRGLFAVGDRGITVTSQVSSERIDLEIPDQVFQFNLNNNGPQRVTAQRDFINEWVYFTYCDNESTYPFPNQTLLYNYRDNSWGIFNENYTTYGQFRKTSGDTWNNLPFKNWFSWSTPWIEGTGTTLFQTQVIAGNQQGFVLFREKGTEEDTSIAIQSFSVSTVTSANHGLNAGDFIIITGALGTVSSLVNNKIFQVTNVTQNTFTIGTNATGKTYLGGALIIRMYIPSIQTKQFPVSWGLSRKTRIGPQSYLFSTTPNAQITLQIFLSENPVGRDQKGVNEGLIIPDPSSANASLIYSSILYTCAESTNLGLTPANVNLQTPTIPNQAQIWHRLNTSLIGDTIEIGFTLSEEQMFSQTPFPSGDAQITAITQAFPCVITCNNTIGTDQLVMITGVVGMTELNFNALLQNYYNVIDRTATTLTIDVDSTAFGAYISGGIATPVEPINQFAEIELHGMILDIQPSQILI